MGKRLKLRIYRVIASTLQSCRSKDPSNLPKDPVPSFSAVNHHLSSAFISVGCAPPTATHPPQFMWQKEDNWHIVANLHHSPKKSDDDDLAFAPPSPPPPERNRRRTKKKRNIPTRLRLSTSSADSGWFSSEGGGAAAAAAEEEETETLVSSSPPSSSELHPIGETQAFTANLPHRRSRRSKSASKRAKRGVVRPPPAAAEGETPARLSMFKKLIPCTVDGKVKESFAIVKRSEDPYEDFKSSMMDMIVEKQMFEQKDLEQLLQCFLSLNSRNYHGIIVQAFSEIWAAIYSPAAECKGGGHCRRRVSRIASF